MSQLMKYAILGLGLAVGANVQADDTLDSIMSQLDAANKKRQSVYIAKPSNTSAPAEAASPRSEAGPALGYAKQSTEGTPPPVPTQPATSAAAGGHEENSAGSSSNMWGL